MKYISVLGSTGSVGTAALRVIDLSPSLGLFAIAADSNVEAMEGQIRRYKPRFAALSNEAAARELSLKVADTGTRVLSGQAGVCSAAAGGADMVLAAIVGMAGLAPVLAAIDAGKDIALANKETLVAAGGIVMAAAREKGISIIPVDSEHSAIFQCLCAGRSVGKIILTASGGPFLGKKAAELKSVSPERAVAHPRWSMGPKISVDSATLMNKGLEVIEAMHLFDISPDKIEVLIHPQSIVHSMVEFSDNSVLAQLGCADMALPISYALHYPKAGPKLAKGLDLAKVGALTFEKPDIGTFRALPLAYEAAKMGGAAPAALNAANEAAVEAFLGGDCAFLDIAEIAGEALKKHKRIINPSLESILYTDEWAREHVYSLTGRRAARERRGE